MDKLDYKVRKKHNKGSLHCLIPWYENILHWIFLANLKTEIISNSITYIVPELLKLVSQGFAEM